MNEYGKKNHKKVSDEMFISPRYHISVDQFLLDMPPEKNMKRRQLDAHLDAMSDSGIRIVTATAKEIATFFFCGSLAKSV